MTILYLTEDYLQSKVHNNLLTTMLQQDENLKIYVLVPIRPIDEPSLEESYDKSDRLIVIKAPIDIPLKRYRYDFWAKIRCKVRLIEKNIPIQEIDAIHAATLFTEGSTARALQKKYNIPYFVSVRGSDSDFYAKKMYHLWLKSCNVIKHANALAFVTPTIKRKMMERWQYRWVRDKLDSGTIINNGIDSIWTDNLSVSPKSLNKEVNILYIGRFDSNKNVMRLIEAVKTLRENHLIRITLVGGDGEEQMQVEQEVAAHSDYITYLGKIYDKQKLMQLVRTCDIFAMVSHGETFGLVYAECLSQGLPILYSKGTGFDNMYPQGHVGYGADSHSIDSIIEGLTYIIKNYSELRNHISELDFNRFCWAGIAQSYIIYMHP